MTNEPTATTYTICTDCNQTNRVPFDSPQGKAPVCGKCKRPLAFHEGVSDLNASGIRFLSQKITQPVVIDFWAPWCQPCKVFAPAFIRAARTFAGQAAFAKIDTQANPLASDAFKIRAVPTFIILNNGTEIARQSGAMPYEQFLAWVNSFIRAKSSAA
jgi:thioredoxin 2